MTTSIWEMNYDDSVRQISHPNWKLWVHEFFFCVNMHPFFIRSRRLYWRHYVLRKLAGMVHNFCFSRISFKKETFFFHLVRFVCIAVESFVMGTLCASMCHYSFAIIMTSTRIFKAIYLDLFGGDFTSFSCLLSILFQTSDANDQSIYYILNFEPIFLTFETF